MYIAHRKKAPETAFSQRRRSLFGLDSHLLQRLAHFDPLPLHRRFGDFSGRIGVAAHAAHLVGGICQCGVKN